MAINGFQRTPAGLYVPSPGGLPGFQRQGMDQRKKASGGNVNAAVTTWNPTGKAAAITLSNGNRRAENNAGGAFCNAQSTTESATRNGTKLYLEITKRIGVGQNSGGVPGAGFLPVGSSTASFVTSYVGGLNYLTYGTTKDNATTFYTGADDWSASGFVLCLALDATGKLAWGRVGATGLWNNSGAANPATGVGGISLGAAASWVIACDPYSAGDQAFDINTGQDAFTGALPAGFVNWG